jgi:hypothetical protein
VFDVPAPTLRGRLHAVRRKLRERLGDEGLTALAAPA